VLWILGHLGNLENSWMICAQIIYRVYGVINFFLAILLKKPFLLFYNFLVVGKVSCGFIYRISPGPHFTLFLLLSL